MTKYEYTFYKRSLGLNEQSDIAGHMKEIMNNYGREGWRYKESEVGSGPGYTEQVYILFERELIEDPANDAELSESIESETVESELSGTEISN